MKKIIVLTAIAAVIAGAAIYWRIYRLTGASPNELLLYGNLDLRQVNLAFNGSERIETVLVQEGDRVEKGQTLGTMEMERLSALAAQAKAKVEAQRHVVERLEHGSRPEEIDQARANVNSARADLTNAGLTYERFKKSAGGGATSQQDLDTAKAAFEVAEARLRVNQKALDLAVIGPRKEDIAEAHSTLLANEAELAVSRQNLAYATLISPANGVVQNRILEPGEMASPQRAVLAIAITDPKWVRVFAAEPDLGKIRMGMAATVSTDSFPGKKYDGWVGFISPVASFTPKTVETTDLRTSLVYEVRIFVKDPADELRLGMPATVRIPLSGNKGS
jgi:HlyD family secretion protein